MRAVIDACVVVDALQSRQPFCADAQRVLLAVANRRVEGLLTARSAADIYDLTRRCTQSGPESRRVIRAVLSLFEILDTAGIDCRRAAASEMEDYAGALTAESAVRAKADCIVTRHERAYEGSPVPICSPAALLASLRPKES